MVSNRVPSFGSQAPQGGLAVALEDILRRTGGLWFGWNGREGPGDDVALVSRQGFELATTSLTREQIAAYYESFANGALWPLFHGRTDISTFEGSDYRGYREVNALFADRLAPYLRDDDIIWLHDYHLIPLAGELRRHVPQARIGFFLHIPFPDPDLFSALPWARELLGDLAACDLVGVQTDNDLRNLKAAFSRIVRASVRAREIVLDGRRVAVGRFPIGIDARRFAELAASRAAERLRRQIVDLLDRRLLIVGAERLDYSKGLAHRMRAYESLIERHAELRSHVSLIQIAAPSRENVPEYLELREELETLTGHINALYGGLDWVPVRYFNQSFSQTRLAALFRASRVGLVTPLRDGMNLVAKEYVAAQDPDDPGVLVLSRFAGAAERMSAALIVNPHDRDGMADAMGQALAMSRSERQDRWQRLADVVWGEDVHGWSRSFLSRLGGHVLPEREPDSLPKAVGPAAMAEPVHHPTAGTPRRIHEPR